MDLKTFEDDELDALRCDVLTEQERRVNLAAIPEQIASLAKMYRDGGGDEETLQEALTPEQVEALRKEAP